MPDKSLIIIGGGLAGLSTGCYAQMNGYTSHILEHHTRPGGLCTAWQRKGYTMDGCIHWLMSCNPGSAFRQMYDELGCFEGNRLVILDDYCRYYDEKSGNSLVIDADFNRLSLDMHRLAPEDGTAIDEFINCCLDLRGFDTGIPDPRELMNIRRSLNMMWQLRGLWKYIFKYNMPVAEYVLRFKNQFLRDCISNLFLPEMPAYFLFAVLGQLIGRQLGYVEGASQRFSDAIARRYLQLGGQIKYKALVDRVIVKEDRAIGVRLEDGSELYADIIVSAADAYSTIFNMLEGRYVDNQIRHRFADWPLFKPVMLVTFGVAREFLEEKPSHNIVLKNPLLIAGQKVSAMHLRIFNYDPTLAPAGKTVLQVTLESDYDRWVELEQDDAGYADEKGRAAQQVLERLEVMYPGITPLIEVTDVATPYTFWYFTRNYRASYEGWLMTKTAVQTILPKTLPGLNNFYMAGQWVEPGGGIPPVLYSGRNVVRILCQKDQKPFISFKP